MATTERYNLSARVELRRLRTAIKEYRRIVSRVAAERDAERLQRLAAERALRFAWAIESETGWDEAEREWGGYDLVPAVTR